MIKMYKSKFMGISSQVSCVDNDGEIWFFSDDYNALFTYRNGNVEYIRSFDKEKFFESQLYNKALAVREEIFFFPLKAKFIACYSKRTNQVHYIDMPERKENSYYNVIFNNLNEVYLFPVEYNNSAYTLYINEKKIKRYNIPWCSLEWNCNFSVNGDAYLNDSAYLAVMYSNIILKFNLEKNIFKKILVSEALFKTHTYKDSIYVSNSSGERIMKLEGNNLITVIESNDTSFKCKGLNEVKYLDFVFGPAGEILLLPLNSDNIKVKNNRITKEITEFENEVRPYGDSIVTREKVYLIPYRTKELLEIDLNTIQYSKIKLEISKKEYYAILIEYLKNEKTAMFDEKNMPIDLYLYLISKGDL